MASKNTSNADLSKMSLANVAAHFPELADFSAWLDNAGTASTEYDGDPSDAAAISAWKSDDHGNYTLRVVGTGENRKESYVRKTLSLTANSADDLYHAIVQTLVGENVKVTDGAMTRFVRSGAWDTLGWPGFDAWDITEQARIRAEKSERMSGSAHERKNVLNELRAETAQIKAANSSLSVEMQLLRASLIAQNMDPDAIIAAALAAAAATS